MRTIDPKISSSEDVHNILNALKIDASNFERYAWGCVGGQKDEHLPKMKEIVEQIEKECLAIISYHANTLNNFRLGDAK